MDFVTAGLAAAPARLGGGGALDVSLGRIVSALILCLVLAVIAGLLLRRGNGRLDLTRLRAWSPARPARRIEVIESRRIGPQAEVCLLRCDGEDYLILSSQGAPQVLRQGPAA